MYVRPDDHPSYKELKDCVKLWIVLSKLGSSNVRILVVTSIDAGKIPK